MPEAIVKDVIRRCSENDLPLWMRRMKRQRGLSCDQLGEAVASMVENARKNSEEPEGGRASCRERV